MTTIDILVIVLCAVIVAAVAVAAIIRKKKGKPSGCADCSHHASDKAVGASAHEAQNIRSGKAGVRSASSQSPNGGLGNDANGKPLQHFCNGNCSGCSGCASDTVHDKK